MNEEKCKNCEFFKIEDSVWGHCKRFPPKEILVKWFFRPKYKMEYPEVLYEDWCGEYKNYNL